ncbi:hypothetical protein PL78_10220 [Yersinia entomophaga]|uniref:Toxin-antitoxin system YwqK family antitoxin n=1 Tax=Yersinia entomophaga TaxID=935293 RepID=A0ABM6BLD4_YERET|nr:MULTISPECIES: toxin-antitoxin system YwqK family antitoxin [Yersinia]ANI30196.1 hypothetical protein PL78_10220 [Yersinia entomophaga]OWF89362.1 hypothetical protein B4914_03320 [Yersinia entomophaga]
MKHWNLCVGSALSIALMWPAAARLETHHPAIIVGMEANAKLPASMDYSGPALRLTLSSKHACGNNIAYITPESIGAPAKEFGSVAGKLKALMDDQTPMLMFLADCQGSVAMVHGADDCNAQTCPEFAPKAVTKGMLYLSEELEPVREADAQYVQKMPMPYDQKLKAWKMEVYDVNTGKLHVEGYIDAEDFASGKMVHPYKTYFSNGKVSVDSSLDANGLREGLTTLYHENGRKATSSTFHNDKPVDGIDESYDEKGKLSAKFSYRGGVFDGTNLEYYPNGKVRSSNPYVKGQPHGPTKSYYEDGTLRNEQVFADGKLEGWSISYYPNGKVESKDFYVKGAQRSLGQWNEEGVQTLQWQWDNDHKEVGVLKQWHSNGQLKEEKPYKDGELNGAVKRWYADGKKEMVTNYVAGKQEGASQVWNEEGKLVSNCIYKNDVRINDCKS